MTPQELAQSATTLSDRARQLADEAHALALNSKLVVAQGAGVHDEFFGYTRADGVGCAKGTLYITPRWQQTHSDDDND